MAYSTIWEKNLGVRKTREFLIFQLPEDLSKNLMGANAVRANYEIKGDTIVYKRYFETLSKFSTSAIILYQFEI